MSSDIYQSEGIILNSYDQGETDKVVTVFTKEYGMLRLFARGTRRASSKLNKFLNIFSYGRFGFVSGKDSWLLIDAEDLGHFDKVFADQDKMKSFGKITRFLERFHKGEMRDPEVYDLILNSADFLGGCDKKLLADFELQFYAKILAILGYIDPGELNLETSGLPLEASARKVIYEAVQEGIASSQM